MSDQLRLQEMMDDDGGDAAGAPVQCLGLTFANDAERRAHFTALLAEKLKEPAFRQIDGFPIGTDEDILALSDPPYYTACPNPFLEEFVRLHGKPYTADDDYARKPFAVDVSVGKTDALYKAHGYHTKVPHLAIVPSILHYTEPGDLVLDGFCGSGMTGVAAQFCGAANASFRQQLELDWHARGWNAPAWGRRRAILNDLSPAATFIAANYNLDFDVDQFARAGAKLLSDLRNEFGWMYRTLHSDGVTEGWINYTVWSEVFACSTCGGDIVFLESAYDQDTQKVADKMVCPNCGAMARKEQLDLQFELFFDTPKGRTERRPKRVPVLINYAVGGQAFEKKPDKQDLEVLDRVTQLAVPWNIPTDDLPDMQMARVGRMATTNVRCVHHFFLPRPAQVLARLWQMAHEEQEPRVRSSLLFFAEQAIWGMSLLARYVPTHYSQVNQFLSGVYYIGSQVAEVSPWYILQGKLSRLTKAFGTYIPERESAIVSTSSSTHTQILSNSTDYIFTDPPFGENIYYADLNFLVESWHKVFSNSAPEAIIDRFKRKDLFKYQQLMQQCFSEYYRVLKPGRWMTVVFHNSRNSVWNAIQEAMLAAGFVVGDVRTLDKQQGSFRQVTSTAVKQDLVISAYKPTVALEQKLQVVAGSEDSAWEFVRSHLRQLPILVVSDGGIEIVAERQDYMLFDRMVAFHVQRQLAVPMSVAEFRSGLIRRFPTRDDMYFLPEQVAEYDRKRMSAKEVIQLSLIVTDESSAIQWLKQQLTRKPQTIQELTPQFFRESVGWQKRESLIDIKDLLEQNFLRYDGNGDVPSQIHSYLSSNYKDMRKLAKDDPALRLDAKDRWYVPDPSKAVDLEKLRERTLLKEFQEYVESRQKQLTIFRVEALRAGFRRAWQEHEYETIVRVAERLPSDALQEDDKLLMWYDQALMRLGR